MQQEFESIKCIWMSSGVVDYRLCDLQFDCENCELDRVMRKQSAARSTQPPQGNLLSRIRQSVAGDKSTNVLYTAQNFVLRKVFQSSHLIGFSPLLWQVVEPAEQVRVAVENGFIRKGEKFIQLSGAFGSTEIAAPFDMYVVSTFAKADTPVARQTWLALIEVDEQSIGEVELSAEVFLASADMHLSKLQNEIVAPVFPTMQDGGVPVTFLYQLIGRRRVVELIETLTKLPE